MMHIVRRLSYVPSRALACSYERVTAHWRVSQVVRPRLLWRNMTGLKNYLAHRRVLSVLTTGIASGNMSSPKSGLPGSLGAHFRGVGVIHPSATRAVAINGNNSRVACPSSAVFVSRHAEDE